MRPETSLRSLYAFFHRWGAHPGAAEQAMGYRLLRMRGLTVSQAYAGSFRGRDAGTYEVPA